MTDTKDLRPSLHILFVFVGPVVWTDTKMELKNMLDLLPSCGLVWYPIFVGYVKFTHLFQKCCTRSLKSKITKSQFSYLGTYNENNLESERDVISHLNFFVTLASECVKNVP